MHQTHQAQAVSAISDEHHPDVVAVSKRSSLGAILWPSSAYKLFLLVSALATSLLLAVSIGVPASAQSQSTIRVEQTPILTYPYSDPDPVPILVKDRRLYPYHSFDGLAAEAEIQDWEVVVLENNYIKVFVLPDAGGKVWGAIEKSTGEEFIYRNEVMKFRNIALRGPWTSGGIEFNFGVIGHTPSTAAAVDYTIRENDDGSVSCFVGTMDLPSRTQWRVEIRLPADKAYFETRTTWYNPTPIEQPYYNWMTAAAFAKDDLVMSIPGNQFLEHSGRANPWPVDGLGRDLSVYKNNQFESHKSYHVVGEYNDYFGGYYLNDNYGFGHWAEHSDMPGQKLWLWSLARDGGIWDDLLTDTDGQYVEYQAGRLFVQYSPGSDVNPITQAGFEPYRTDQWTERWFPLIGIGGLTDASADAAMNVSQNDGRLVISINPFGSGRAVARVIQEGAVIREYPFDFGPMELISFDATIDPTHSFEVVVPELALRFVSRDTTLQIDRPFDQDATAEPSLSIADKHFTSGRELMKARFYREAQARFDSVLASEPWHMSTLLAVAELDFRRGKYAEGISTVNKARQLDGYDPKANYLAGVLYRAVGDFVNAKEAFGWAARSTAFRSAANAHLAGIALQNHEYESAIRLAGMALDYDRYSINALEVRAVAGQKLRSAGAPDSDQFEGVAMEALDALENIDPLSHFVAFERALTSIGVDRRNKDSVEGNPGLEAAASGNQTNLEAQREEWASAVSWKTALTSENLEFVQGLRSEFPDQVLLELGIAYYARGLLAEAATLLMVAADEYRSPLASIWLGYLLRDVDPNESSTRLNNSIAELAEMARPYRLESVPVLQWLVNVKPGWKAHYLLGLNFWAVDRDEDAADQFALMKDDPNTAAAYISRATLLLELNSVDPEADLRKALVVNDSDRRTWLHLHRYLEQENRAADALELSAKMYDRFSDSFVVRLAHVRSLLNGVQPKAALEILRSTRVLPAEGAGGGQALWMRANFLAGLRESEQNRDGCDAGIPYFEAALLWPEHLGQGKPYQPEERLPHFLIAFCHENSDRKTQAERFYSMVADAPRSESSASDFMTYVALSKLGRLQDVTNLVEQLRNASPTSPMADWVLSSIEKDQLRAERIRARHPNLMTPLDWAIFGTIVEIQD